MTQRKSDEQNVHNGPLTALPSRANGHVTAKLLWPRRGDVNPAVVQRRCAFLPGEISPYARKGDGVEPEREVSRGRSSRTSPMMGHRSGEGPNERMC